MKRNNKKKENQKIEKSKLELKQIRADLIKLKKSKKRMQLLWYRTKKEHVALIKDLDQRLKALRKGTSAKKTRKNAVGKKQVKNNQINKNQNKTAARKK